MKVPSSKKIVGGKLLIEFKDVDVSNVVSAIKTVDANCFLPKLVFINDDKSVAFDLNIELLIDYEHMYSDTPELKELREFIGQHQVSDYGKL